MRRLRNFIASHTKSPASRLLLLAAGAGGLLTFILSNFEMSLFEAKLYDLRMREKGSRPVSGQVVLVKIDDRTVERLNEFPPLGIRRHTALLRALGAGHPKAVAYFVNFNEVLTGETGAAEKRFRRDADEFVAQADALAAAGTEVMLGTGVDVTGEVVPPFPLSKLPHRVAILHKDGTTFAEDKVTRRAFFSIYDEPVLHVRLASLLNAKVSASDYRGIYYMPEVDARYFYINYAGPTQEKRHPFAEVSASELFEGRADPSIFRDKVVLIGAATREDSADYAYTPYSREMFTNTKLTVHANIIETLLRGDAIVKASRPFDLALTLVLTVLVIALVLRTSPVRGVIVTSAAAAAVLAASVATFRWAGLWVTVAHPLLGIFFAYYVFVPYRLIMEYKKRWQFQKRNEVLVQVEELKSNFMSLITHDLKTPVARIQGMAEVLGRSGADAAAVSAILDSTVELDRFITSILELARIESDRVRLDRQSKDVNRIIEECARKAAFLARARKIDLRADLEPLFPIRIDASLVTKVISNLIDNAIKYSPEGARVSIESRESARRPGHVEIRVRDTGYGIGPHDLENLFSKFYRARNDATMRTKGTGLGLYLSRYFVELHEGTLTAESVEGKGSVFTIVLPENEPGSSPALSQAEGESAYV